VPTQRALRYARWTVRGVLALLLLTVLHYTLPQTDVVRIIGTETRRMDFGENAFFWSTPDVGTAAGTTRDVKFIETVLYASGRVMVYRNEDTGWGWPPYFKINSFNLQAQATNLISSEAAPRWVVMTHYGWRNEFFTIFPNAIAVRVTDDPDALRIPWINLAILAGLAGLALWVRALWRRFRRRTIAPVLQDVGAVVDRVDARADAARDRAAGVWGRLRAWLDTWRGKPRR
jgi:hypothetical protein